MQRKITSQVQFPIFFKSSFDFLPWFDDSQKKRFVFFVRCQTVTVIHHTFTMEVKK